MIPTALLVHTDWIRLPATARVIFIDICKMHHHGGERGPGNNGQIGYGCAAGARAASVSVATADRMLNRIRKGGLLKLRKEGIFNVKAGEGRTREWEIKIYPIAGRPLTAWGESKLHIDHWLLKLGRLQRAVEPDQVHPDRANAPLQWQQQRGYQLRRPERRAGWF